MRIVITGASKGIGRGIAEVLANYGHSLGLLARSGDLLSALKKSIENLETDCYISTCDLRDPVATNDVIADLIERLHGIDALINNAGVIIRKDIFKLSVEEWLAMIETNINGVFFASRTAIPYFVAQKSGHIINISSISGRLPLQGGSGYAATKHAVTGFSESLFQEVRDYGVKVTTIFPGSVDTASHSTKKATDDRWKITPNEIGEACQEILNTSTRNCISRLEIRPLNRPPSSP